MRRILYVAFAITCVATAVIAQTADELVAKNLQAKGGLEKIKAITSVRMIGKLNQGGFIAQVGEEAKAPSLFRQTFTIQGMTEIDAYDGQTGWKISPFEGRKDPEILGEDEMRDIVEQADFYGPLVDPREKGNTIEYLGHGVVDGDDVYRLKVTLKNGDIFYYSLDPDTFLEIRIEKQQLVRGAIHESITDLGSYKLVNGVYYPFSLESGPKANPNARAKITLDKIEANIEIPENQFKMPQAPVTPSPQSHPEPPQQGKKPSSQPAAKPPAPKPPTS